MQKLGKLKRPAVFLQLRVAEGQSCPYLELTESGKEVARDKT